MGRLGLAIVFLSVMLIVVIWGYRIGYRRRRYPDDLNVRMDAVHLSLVLAGVYLLAVWGLVKLMLWLGWYPD